MVEEGDFDSFFLYRAPWTEGPDIHKLLSMVKLYFEGAPQSSPTARPHKSATDKRPRGSPTGETPLQTSKRRPAVSCSRSGVCRSLFSPWTNAKESTSLCAVSTAHSFVT